MRKILSALLFVGCASVSQAAIVNLVCTPAPLTINGSSGNGEETCDTSALVGTTINSISVFLSFDIVTNSNPSAAADFEFDLPGTSVDFASSVTFDLRPVSNGGQFVDSTEFGLWNSANSVTIFDSFVGNANVTAGTFVKEITVDYTPNDTTIPEPTSMALLGAGLLGIGFFARRRKA